MSTAIRAAIDDIRINLAIVVALVAAKATAFVILPLWLLPMN